MDKKFDIGDFINAKTQRSVLNDLTERVRKRRKEMKFTQKELAARSGVSYASVRRFETCGEISLSSLMSIAAALDCLEDFDGLFAKKAILNLKDFEG